MASFETEAVVLKIFDHGESDKIITMYSHDLGKITAIAKGAKRSKIRFVGKLELFNHLQATVADNRHSSLMRIDEAELLNPYPALRSDYERFVCAALISELVLNWTAAHDRDDSIFHLLTWTFSRLNEGQALSTLLLFQLHLLSLLGFHLHLSSCARCGMALDSKGTYSFSLPDNGVICSPCDTEQEEGQQPSVPLSLGTIKLLDKARQLTADKWPRLQFSRQSEQEAMALFQAHHDFLLQRDIVSWKELHSIYRLP